MIIVDFLQGMTFPWLPLGMNDVKSDGVFVHLNGNELNTTLVDFWQGGKKNNVKINLPPKNKNKYSRKNVLYMHYH